MNLLYLEGYAQIKTNTERFVPPKSILIKPDSNNLSRVVKLKIDSQDINLSDDFLFKVVSNRSTIELKPLRNTILLPNRFPKDSVYEVIFTYSKYELHFNKILGGNFNYLSEWKFLLSTANDSEAQKTNLWLFEPLDKDGWEIESDKLIIR